MPRTAEERRGSIKRVALLESTDPSLLIVEDRSRSDVVVGVPHHAPAGIPYLPCPEHSDADENTGYLGQYLAERLDCCSVIACNATIDANKHMNSLYSQRIIGWQPDILIEIHGHGKVRSAYDVEISCGSSALTGRAEKLAANVNERLSADGTFADLSVCGRFADLYFRATKTLTINDPRWLAYHIELSPRLRKPVKGPFGPPTPYAYRFCGHLAEAFRDIHP